MILVDANLLIYAHSSSFSQHRAARVWAARASTERGAWCEGVPESWSPVLSMIGATYLPSLVANARAFEAGESSGRPIKVIYHSHCDAGAYFSAEDAATFAAEGDLWSVSTEGGVGITTMTPSWAARKIRSGSADTTNSALSCGKPNDSPSARSAMLIDQRTSPVRLSKQNKSPCRPSV